MGKALTIIFFMKSTAIGFAFSPELVDLENSYFWPRSFASGFTFRQDRLVLKIRIFTRRERQAALLFFGKTGRF